MIRSEEKEKEKEKKTLKSVSVCERERERERFVGGRLVGGFYLSLLIYLFIFNELKRIGGNQCGNSIWA